jgi:hypothetical protein
MSALTAFAAVALAGAALFTPAATATSCPPKDGGYTVMDDYVRSLVFWHRNPDWGFPIRDVPAPSCRLHTAC